MIRAVIALFVVAVALCGYIIINQQPNRQAASPLPMANGQGDVTRATTAPLLSQDIAQQPTPAVVQTPPAAVVLPAPVIVQTPVAPTRSDITIDQVDLVQTTANVLAGLGLHVDVRNMSNGTQAGTVNVLADLGVIPEAEQPKPAPRSALEFMVIALLKEGLSDTEIDERINAAALAGEISVPKILVTPQGTVDTEVLLEAIVTTARSVATGIAPPVPDVPTGEGSGVEVRVVQRAAETEQYRFYTVAAGDSLGGISAKFYGDVNKFQIIYEANRGLLSSPDQIKVGQRLAIPKLPEA